MKAKNSFLRKAVLLLYISILHALILMAQFDSGKVEVIKDPRIDLLVKKQAQINRVAVFKNSRGEYKGYRIMIMNTNNRDVAYKTRAEVLRYYPEHNVYMAYQSPYYKIKMGDFLKKADADKFKRELTSMFPQGTFVIQDIIKLSPEDEARLLKEAEGEE
ncbi:MAG: SPOR domain-containing protein [Bacteroidota bacterium]